MANRFVAAPESGVPHPGVVVLHEMWGLNDDMRRICRRFADEGYAAICVDLYSHGAKPFCLARVVVDFVA